MLSSHASSAVSISPWWRARAPTLLSAAESLKLRRDLCHQRRTLLQGAFDLVRCEFTRGHQPFDNRLSRFGRELGVPGIREFVNIKSVWIA